MPATPAVDLGPLGSGIGPETGRADPLTAVVSGMLFHTHGGTPAPNQEATCDGDSDAFDQLPDQWGDYQDVTLVARGGMGAVYRARNAHLDRVEAVKVLLEAEAGNRRARRRFDLEAVSAAGLAHPNIVKVYGGGQVDGRPYFAMQWLDGGDLTARRSHLTDRPLELAGLMAKVARAVHHAHQLGILHRDLKPSNVLLDAAGEPHVSDFGLAKRLDGDLGVTRLGAVVGTPQYMAPEQAVGDAVTTAADVYGLGGVLYFLLTGRPPFTGVRYQELINRIVMEPPDAPRRLNPAVDRDLEAICLKCLEKNPRDRYPSAAALADDLDRYVRGEQATVRTPTLGEWLRRELRKQPPPFNGYVWQAKLWFAGLILFSQAATVAAAAAGGPAWWVVAAFAVTWVGVAAAVWYYKAARFTRLPVVEQHAVMISFGLIAGQMAVTLSAWPGCTTAADLLSVYPATFAITGVALVALGATHWGAFYPMGLAALLAVPVARVWPPASPWLFGLGLSAAMVYWAVKIRTTFGREPPQ